MKKILFLTIIIFSFFSTCAQLSNKHWIPPLHANESQDPNLILDHYLYLSTPEPTPFQVSIKTGDGIDFVAPVTISQGNPASIFIGNDQPSVIMLERQDVGNVVSGKGIILEGQYDFYVNFRVRSANHAEFLSSKGRTGAGNIFRLGSLPQSYSSGIRNFVTGFMATEDNTTVTVSDYDPNVTFIQGFIEISSPTQTFNLNAGESVVLSGYLNNGANFEGFVGALLESDKPIVVNTGNMAGGMGNQPPGGGSAQDFNLDQIVPLNQVGMEYVIMKGNGSDNTELPMVIAHEDNTEVFVNDDNAPIATINAGEYFLIPTAFFTGISLNANMYIRTSKPAYLYQIVGGSSSDATSGLYFIPPLSCFWQNSVDSIPYINEIGTQTNFNGNLIIATEAGSTILINGVPTTASPIAVLGNPNWETYRIGGLTGNVSVESSGALAVGVFSASGNAGIGGYFSGFGSTPSGSSIDVCTGGIVDLFDKISGNPEPGGNWYFNGSPRSPNNGLFNPASDPIGTYTYIFTKTCDGIDRDIPIDIVINAIQPGPNVGTSTTKSYCITDASEDLTNLLGSNITPGGNWTYNGSPRPSGTIDPSVDLGGTYTYTIPAQGVCDEVSASVTVTINPSPVLENVTNLEECDDFVLNISSDTDGETLFNLSNKTPEIIGNQTNVSVKYYEILSDAEIEATNNINSIRATSGKIIYYRIENQFGCFQTGNFELIVHPKPTIESEVTLKQCDDDTDTQATFVLTQANGLISTESNLIFTFHYNASGAENNNNLVPNPDSFIASNGSVVWARIENQFGCYRIAKVNLVVSTTQFPPNFVPQIYPECDDYIDVNDVDNDGFDYFDIDTFYTNDIINAFPLSQQAFLVVSYYESYDDAELVINPITNISNYRNSTPGGNPIWARVDSQLNNDPGCKGIQELELVVEPIPQIDLGINFTLCLDPILGTGAQTVDASPSVSGSYSYTWSSDVNGLDLTNESGATYTITQPGTYDVVVVNNLTGCRNTDSITATFSSEPATFEASVTTEPFSAGLSTIVGIASGGFGIYEYSLDLINWQTSPIFNNIPTGTHTIYVRDIQGCGILSVNNLLAITYPNFFTPNGDGFNDVWNISGLPEEYNAKLFIFDRYGKLIKQISPYGNGWNGTYNGEPLPSNDYWFVLEYTIDDTKKELKSHFSLKR